MVKVVPWSRPLEAKLVIEALASPTRVNIVRHLLDEEGLSASELAKRLNLSIPTVMEHLSALMSAGLVKWEWRTVGGRQLKVYSVVDRKISLQLDLDSYARLPSKQKFDELLHEYVERSLSRGWLPAKPTVEAVCEVLNVDWRVALALVEHALMNEEEVVDHLLPKALEALEDLDELAVDELSRRLKVHEYWAARVARRLEERGGFRVENGRIKRLKEDLP